MSKYVCNISNIIDIDYILKVIDTRESKIVCWSPESFATDHKDYPLNRPNSIETTRYNLSVANVSIWNDTTPNYLMEDYYTSVNNFMKIKIISSWVSRLDPGCICPMHNDGGYTEIPDIKRYHCQLSPDAIGTVLFVDDEMFSLQHGQVFLWDMFDATHGASNINMTPFYLWSFLAVDA